MSIVFTSLNVCKALKYTIISILICTGKQYIFNTNWPYFGVKLSCVCLKFALKKKKNLNVTYSQESWDGHILFGNQL